MEKIILDWLANPLVIIGIAAGVFGIWKDWQANSRAKLELAQKAEEGRRADLKEDYERTRAQLQDYVAKEKAWESERERMEARYQELLERLLKSKETP